LPDREVFTQDEQLLRWLWLDAQNLLDMSRGCPLDTLTTGKFANEAHGRTIIDHGIFLACWEQTGKLLQEATIE